MEKLKQILGIISVVVSIFVSIVTLYFYFKKDNPKLEVTTYVEQLITQQRNIEDLKATYVYKDSLEVNNLWQSKCIIRNVGKCTIVGQGDNSTLIDDGISYSFSDSVKVLYCDISNNTIGAKIENNSISFKQWRRNEFIEINAWIESDQYPQFRINHRDIIDADVDYKQISTQDEKEKLVEYLPKEVATILRYVWLIYQFCFTFLTFPMLKELMRRLLKPVLIKLLSAILGNFVKNCPEGIILNLYCLVIYAILFLPVLWLF